jgi:hypothetical protein
MPAMVAVLPASAGQVFESAELGVLAQRAEREGSWFAPPAARSGSRGAVRAPISSAIWRPEIW